MPVEASSVTATSVKRMFLHVLRDVFGWINADLFFANAFFYNFKEKRLWENSSSPKETTVSSSLI